MWVSGSKLPRGGLPQLTLSPGSSLDHHIAQSSGIFGAAIPFCVCVPGIGRGGAVAKYQIDDWTNVRKSVANE